MYLPYAYGFPQKPEGIGAPGAGAIYQGLGVAKCGFWDPALVLWKTTEPPF